ncbi:DNA internalization-related competence protein ComEC/Rec2 [Oceanobacillus saliphilus]|uniref:DNA internalization-related competence protein ComEC/Rec2 n=1 Tax=Oceanobacillus saliphilus TaxID=2925834 RepID=UPI00201E5FC2
MKGYWHFPAFAAGTAILYVFFNTNWIIVAFLLWLFYLYFYERLRKWPIIISLTVFILFLFFIPDTDHHQLYDHHFPSEETNFSGTIISPVTSTKDKLEFIMEESTTNQKILVLYFPPINDESFKNNKFYKSMKHGANCTLKGTAELPAESRNPNQFDYRHFLLTQGITHQLILDSLENIQCSGSSFLNRFYTARQFLLTHVENKLSAFSSSWLTAIVFGDDSNIDDETEEIFQRWSLTHIIAISGTHIGLIVGLCYFLLIRLNMLTKEKSQWLMVILLPVYALLAGGAPSVWRASTMVVIFILLNKYKLKFSYTDVLSIVFLLLILIDNYIVYHVGFQLSFIVTLAILLSKKWISETDSIFWQVLQINFVSQMAIIPIQFAYFSLFQPLSIIINLIIIPYFTIFVIPLMYSLLPLTFLPDLLIQPFDLIFAGIHKWVLAFIRMIDRLFFYPFLLNGFPINAAAIYFVLFFVFMNDLQRKKLKQSLVSGLFMCFLIIGIAAKPYFSETGTVTMFDIGQGDAFLIELPYRKGVLMIDAGARFSFEDMEATEKVYQQILKPYFYSRGIRRLDALILTHDDLDHVGSVPFIMKDLAVDEIIITEYFDDTFLRELAGENSPTEITRVGRNDYFEVGNHGFYVLAPHVEHMSANENSLVLYTELGGESWLFTGDIGKNEEKELLETYPNLSLYVLKVAHHGSNTSTDKFFLEKTNPKFALISVGESNSYGHPAMEVVQTLKEEETIILRTDRNGAVQYLFNEHGGTFYTHLP